MVHLQVHSNGPVLDDEILEDAEVQDAIKNEGSVHRKFKILNTDRATFGRVGGAVAKLHGDSGFAGNLSFDLEVMTPLLHTVLHTSLQCVHMHLCSKLCTPRGPL